MRGIILSLHFVFLTKDANYRCTVLLGLNSKRNYIEYMYCLLNKGCKLQMNRPFRAEYERNYIEYM